jgi:predicted ATP-grasp superfamily ATP-dependent carboligase
LGFPLVFKPLSGVSCQGISIVSNGNEVKMAINKIKAGSSNEFFLVQKFLLGVAASVSLVSSGVEAVPITLNEQLLALESSSSQLSSAYYGGVVPLRHPMEKKALQIARKAVEAVRGLQGYVGVDMVLTSEGPVVMEINPRLTTSYVGLTKVVDFNPAQAIIDAVVERKLPRNLQVSGCTYFSKVKIKAPIYETLLKTYKLSEMVSPPFPVGDGSETFALLASKADELENAKAGFEVAKKRLNNILLEG